MKFTVGGESHDLTSEEVVQTMRDVEPEPAQKHVVLVEGRAFPPKQVFATVTGRSRQSFTTMEAQRVLTRLGFVCRRADRFAEATGETAATRATVEDRIAGLEATLSRVLSALAGVRDELNRLDLA